MSFFRASPFYDAEPTFTPLFRLLDDFDNYSRQTQGTDSGRVNQRAHVKTFTPKFDLKETEDAYELHGELPGVEKDNITIEFSDPQTIVIRGRSERSYTAGTPPAGGLEGTQMSGAITEGGEKQQQQSHKATVEDETPQGQNKTTEVAKSDQKQQPQEPKVRYWVSERSVGEFTRSFNFPTRIDADGVKAGLNNGILTIHVPKAKKHESRRIAVN